MKLLRELRQKLEDTNVCDDWVIEMIDEMLTRDAGLVMVKFNADCGRMGSLEGVYVHTKEDHEKFLQDMETYADETIYWCEPFGKHSELSIEVSDLHKYLTYDTDSERCLAAKNQHYGDEVVEKFYETMWDNDWDKSE